VITTDPQFDDRSIDDVVPRLCYPARDGGEMGTLLNAVLLGKTQQRRATS
jgi:hypothetical protein